MLHIHIDTQAGNTQDTITKTHIATHIYVPPRCHALYIRHYESLYKPQLTPRHDTLIAIPLRHAYSLHHAAMMRRHITQVTTTTPQRHGYQVV